MRFMAKTLMKTGYKSSTPTVLTQCRVREKAVVLVLVEKMFEKPSQHTLRKTDSCSWTLTIHVITDC